MALNYDNHQVATIIGTKSGTTYTPVTLTATNTDNAKVFATGGFSKLNLDVKYTTGATETNNTCDIVLQASPDGTNFFQLTNESASSGTSTLYQRTFTFTGASSATAYSYTVGIDVFYKYVKVLVSEGGVVTNFGTVSIEATLSGK